MKVQKERLDRKTARTRVLWGYSLILASWIALDSPRYKVKGVALYCIPFAHNRLSLDVRSGQTSHFVMVVRISSEVD